MRYGADLQSPAQESSQRFLPEFTLKFQGFGHARQVYWNLNPEELYEEALFRREGYLGAGGVLVVPPGRHSVRATNDTFVVQESTTSESIGWGIANQPYSPEAFSIVLSRMQAWAQGRDIFVQDVYVCRHSDYRVPVRIITENAWQSMVCETLYQPVPPEDRRSFFPEWTIISLPSFQASPEIDGSLTSTVIITCYEQRTTLIGGSAYAGEIKQAVFRLIDERFSRQGTLPLHGAVNYEPHSRKTSVFIGPTGTGKTVLAIDPTRLLVGDDVMIWGDEGIFSVESGCYSKIAGRFPDFLADHPSVSHQFGTILENVVCDPVTRQLTMDDPKISPNARAIFALNQQTTVEEGGMADHPGSLFLLVADPLGVIPFIARISAEQAAYYFMLGYSGNPDAIAKKPEKEPELLFSPCMGSPCMMRHPGFYGEMFRRKVLHHQTECWLINTGWFGGKPNGHPRIPLSQTRMLIQAAQQGVFNKGPWDVDPRFGWEIPRTKPAGFDYPMQPWLVWQKRSEYDEASAWLAARMVDQFKHFGTQIAHEIQSAGPPH